MSWCPFASRSLTFVGSPTFASGFPFRGVIHTVEGSLSSALSTYKKTNSYPHFTVDGSKIEQHRPINVAATALAHPSGTIETNRACAIQIEVAGFAEKVDRIDDATWRNLANLMQWIEDETGIKHKFPAFKPYPSSYGRKNGVRFSDDAWRKCDFWVGHQHVPYNDHGDPGALPVHKLVMSSPAVIGPIVQHGDDMQSQSFKTLPLDKDGNGYIDTRIPHDKFVSLVPLGPSPDRDGYGWPNWYWSMNNTDGQARIAIEEGEPNKPVGFIAWFVD